jgi:hypothetical protein
VAGGGATSRAPGTGQLRAARVLLFWAAVEPGSWPDAGPALLPDFLVWPCRRAA